MRAKFIVTFAAAYAAIFMAPAALAKPVDASTVTCTEMLEVATTKGDDAAKKESQARIGLMLIWMQGYKAPADHGTVADVKSIMGGIDRVVDMCSKTPNFGLMTVTEKLWAADAEVSKDAVDLSTVTCTAWLKTNDTDRTGMVMWLLGYHAAVAEDPMFELDAVGEKVKNLATYCTENPDMGLVTASEKSAE